ncbi:hypothetical protein PIB30_026497 [Stylosanthes scabra]|uniref:Legume lectin domain-containing protein n=1 Tax=Stylosanthes scabra TaxID=79078 RepID=A0ABU6Y7K1_9FABA|nr:hypothetical protein [Stylosanthes scabra]
MAAAAISKKLIPLVAMLTIPLIIIFTMMTQTVYSSRELLVVFDEFENDYELHLEGDATISANNEIQLTKIQNGNPLPRSVGRVTYSNPIRLWDRSTGEVASLHTTFKFLIDAPYTTPPADGLAFFIAPHNATLPPDSYAALLGLFPGPPDEIHSNNIVAVEFDTFTNHVYQDPDYKHIGIDVNSIISKATTEWKYWRNGVSDNVRVEYDPHSKKLKVTSYYTSGDIIELSHEIDLTTVLPEWVRIGFSGATGDYTQSNIIQSWFFHVKLEVVNNGVSARDEGYIASVM